MMLSFYYKQLKVWEEMNRLRKILGFPELPKPAAPEKIEDPSF